MNDDHTALFHAADAHQRTLEADLVDRAIIGGAKDAASLLDSDEVRQRLAQLAFTKAVEEQNASQGPPVRDPGPRRRSKQNPSKRKAAKAARRRNR